MADRPLMVMQFCVCDQDMCFCAESAMVKLDDAAKGIEWTCPKCRVGDHQFDMNPRRPRVHVTKPS